jgi:hypothetical protein
MQIGEKGIENLFTIDVKYKHFKDTFPFLKNPFFFFSPYLGMG